MADIELIVRIDEKLYKDIYSDAEIMIYGGMRSGKTLLATLLRAIRNSTPLPKGHGRLIDADELIRQYNLDEATKYGNKNAKQQAHSYSTMMLYEISNMIDDAPTIIEADKE